MQKVPVKGFPNLRGKESEQTGFAWHEKRESIPHLVKTPSYLQPTEKRYLSANHQQKRSRQQIIPVSKATCDDKATSLRQKKLL